MLASAATPAAFPPTLFDVEMDGQPYQDMHVDGDAMAQVFLYPPRLFDAMRGEGRKVRERERKVYIIRNARLDPQWATVERSALDIAGRAISSLIQTQGSGDLIPDLSDRATGWSGLQSDVYRLRLHRRA